MRVCDPEGGVEAQRERERERERKIMCWLCVSRLSDTWWILLSETKMRQMGDKRDGKLVALVPVALPSETLVGPLAHGATRGYICPVR